MKKAVLCIALAACVSSAQAQQLKFMLGPTFSNYTGRWPSSVFMGSLGQPSGLDPFKNTKVGTIDGIGIEIKLVQWLRLEVDGLYGNWGSSFSTPTTALTGLKEAYTLTQLSFPILLKLRPSLKRAVPYVMVGAEPAAILAHTRTSLVLPEGSRIYDEVLREDLGKATKSFDIGPIVGIGFEMPLLGQGFLVEARYRIGLVNLVNGYPSDVYNAKLRSFTLLIGYQWK